MDPRRILLAISGGIAAYKTPELVRALRREGHEVRCALTPEATRFVAPLSLQAVSGKRVRMDLFDAGEEGEIDHIGLADWADLVLVAPCTANLMAKMSHGLADDLVTAVLLATRAPVLVAPAMNVNMWTHPATQGNLALLRTRGLSFVGPDEGELACGWEGQGRMSDPDVLVEAVQALLSAKTLAGERVLVTAGGTSEAIDAVRAEIQIAGQKAESPVASGAKGVVFEFELPVGTTKLQTWFFDKKKRAGGAYFTDVDKVCRALAKAQVAFQPENPVTALMADTGTGALREDVLGEKVLSCILEFQTDVDRMPAILEVIEEAVRYLDTVVALGAAIRCNADGRDAVQAQLKVLGYDAWRGKINMGLGRRSTPRQVALSGHSAMPSSRAARWSHSRRRSSSAASAWPPLLLTASRIRKSPSALGTRTPLAAVCGFSRSTPWSRPCS